MNLGNLLREIFSTVQGMFPDALWGTADDILANPNQHALGLVIFPGNRSNVGKAHGYVSDFNSVFNEWGHTAVYVRVDNKVVVCLGFDPHRGKMIIYAITGKTKDIERGRIQTPGQLYVEGSLISFPDAFAIEFPLDELDARRLADRLLSYKIGEYGHYSTQDVKNSGPFNVDDKGNCISFIRAVLKSTLSFDLYTTIGSLYGTNYSRIDLDRNLYDFGAAQARLTPLARRGQVVLRSSNLAIPGKVIRGEVVRKGTFAEITHNLTDTYMRTTFARVLLEGSIYIGGRVVEYCAPSVARSFSKKLGFLLPRLGTHHYLVAVCYLLLTLRTGIPVVSNSRLWKLLYQVLNALSIFQFVRYVRTNNSSVLTMGSYEVGRTLLYLVTTKALRLKFN